METNHEHKCMNWSRWVVKDCPSSQRDFFHFLYFLSETGEEEGKKETGTSAPKQQQSVGSMQKGGGRTNAHLQ